MQHLISRDILKQEKHTNMHHIYRVNIQRILVQKGFTLVYTAALKRSSIVPCTEILNEMYTSSCIQNRI